MLAAVGEGTRIMTTLVRAAIAAGIAGSFSIASWAQSAPVAGPPAPVDQKAIIPIEGEVVLVEPANFGVGRSRTIVVAGTEEQRASFRNINPAVARTRWRQGQGARNFYIEAAEFKRMQKVAHNWELAFLGMSALDTVQTVATVSNGDAREYNPLLGRKPSAGKVLAYMALRSGLHYSLFRYANARNPNTARKAAMASFVIQSGIVGVGLATAW